MALKKVYIGSIGPFLYDDADPIDDPDGDFPGENQRALLSDGGVTGDPIGNTTGSDTDFTVIVAIQVGGIGPVGFQYKTRALTLEDGLIKAVGAESVWIDV